MANTMMRVTSDVTDKLKLLKKVSGFKGSYQDMVDKLVMEELAKTHFYTVDGHVTVDAVVLNTAGKYLVVEAVDKDRITFRDGSSLMNGGSTSYALRLFADSVSSCGVGFTDG